MLKGFSSDSVLSTRATGQGCYGAKLVKSQDVNAVLQSGVRVISKLTRREYF